MSSGTCNDVWVSNVSDIVEAVFVNLHGARFRMEPPITSNSVVYSINILLLLLVVAVLY